MTHIHEKIDFTATVFIVCENRVLLRLHDKYHQWFGVGGHIELDEDPVQAAMRECYEEVGLAVTIYDPEAGQVPTLPDRRHLASPSHLNIHYVNETHQHIDLLYYASSTTDQVTPESETDQWLWLSATELHDHPDIDDQIKYYASGALTALAT